MAHFYGQIQGQRSPASRTGTKNSGMWANITGWNSGVYINLLFNPETNSDEIYVYRTGGSNNPDSRTLIEIIGVQP